LPGLFIAGNAYRGVGINDSIADALRAARDVLDYLVQWPLRGTG